MKVGIMGRSARFLERPPRTRKKYGYGGMRLAVTLTVLSPIDGLGRLVAVVVVD
jgi:hypothetical protein